MNTEITAIKKITAKDIGAEGKKEHIGKNLYAVKGIVRGYTVKNTQYGETYGLQGDFVAQNLITGNVYSAPTAYLPQDFTDSLLNQLKNSNDGMAEIEFNLQVKCAASERGAMGFTYVCTPIATPQVIEKQKALLAGFLSDTSHLAIEDKSNKAKK